MRSLAILAVVLAISGLSYQITSQQLIQAVNKARTNPVYYANQIASLYTSKGVKGTSNDALCYQEAENFLRSMKALPALKESIAADLAAWKHSNWMSTTKTFSHTGLSGSTPKTRLEAVGTWTSGMGYTENIAYYSAAVPAETFVIMWLTDCGISTRGHRNNIMTTTAPFLGCGESGMYVTCDGAKDLTLLPSITAATLQQAGLSTAVNGAGYTGV